MSFLHCHNCNWSQDDFWYWNWKGIKTFWKWKYRPFGYNPISLILEDIATYIRPRYIGFDSSYAKEVGFKSNSVFSWYLMLWNIKRHFLRIFSQKWWSYDQWKNDQEAVCPHCKTRNFDID